MRMTNFISLIGALTFLLTACGGNSSAPAETETLPIAGDKPTFIFFFTDN